MVFIGHDRGGRITYIAALNAPERVKGAVVMDIVPGSYMWANMNFANGHSETRRSSHWVSFLVFVFGRLEELREDLLINDVCIDLSLVPAPIARDPHRWQREVLL